MDIIVPIKQVPETSNVKMDPETGTMIRAGVETVVNPLDLYAIETAIRLKEQFGGTITAMTMGPPPAEKALREAIAMGCDGGVLVSDRTFGGADTWATSYTLAQAIRAMGRFDLVVAGERATDGDTAQVGPGIAAWLGIPLATYVAAIGGAAPNTAGAAPLAPAAPGVVGAAPVAPGAAGAVQSAPSAAGGPGAAGAVHWAPSDTSAPAAVGPAPTSLSVERLVEEGYQMLNVPLPALMTVVKEIAAPRLPTLRGKKRAMAADIPVYNAENMDLDPTFLGLKGSPTKVVRIATPKVTRSGTVVHASDQDSTEAAVEQLLTFLDSRDLLPGTRPAGGRS